MVSAVDDGVGLVLSKLAELNLMDNTIIVFLSDNGGPGNANGSDNGILRGQKSDLFEGGIRVPFAMQWPAKIKAGTIYDRPVISLDIFATVIAQTKTPVKTKNPIDGVNLLPYLTGENKGEPHDFLFWRKFDAQDFAVRNGNQKMVIKKGSEKMLFDLGKDISEQNDINVESKDKTETMLNELKKWESQTVGPKFLGLSQDKEYNALNPDRFKKPAK
jgi:arylsulfatase A-like enzyme